MLNSEIITELESIAKIIERIHVPVLRDHANRWICVDSLKNIAKEIEKQQKQSPKKE